MTTRKSCAASAAFILTMSLSTVAFAQDAGVGVQAEVKAEAKPGAVGSSAGESCRARSDCAEGLKCIEQVCRDPNNPSAGGSASGSAGGGSGNAGSGGDSSSGSSSGGESAGGGSSGGGGDLLDGELEGLRAHMGIIFGGGPSHLDDPADIVQGSLLFSLKGGILIDRIELGLEFAPATYVINFDPDLPSVHLIGYGGYHIPVFKSISWPLRLGIGLTQPTFRGETRGLDALLALRADLIGVSVLLADQFLIDAHLPSWRINVDPNAPGALFSYIFGVGASWTPKL
jgi:hypothetical protein